MGKQRRRRIKLHLSSSNTQKDKPSDEPIVFTKSSSVDDIPTLETSEDVFKGLNIDITSLNTNLPDDTRSVRSFKSLKSEHGFSKHIGKKEKLKLRRELLLKKIDTVEQLKKEYEIRNRRKKTAIMGDMNPLYDALPSLESLLKSSESSKVKTRAKISKTKGTEKASKRRKRLLKEVGIFKKVLGDKKFKENPLAAVSEHVKAVVESDKVKKNK